MEDMYVQNVHEDSLPTSMENKLKEAQLLQNEHMSLADPILSLIHISEPTRPY